jgi:hypothetical protein
MTHRQVSPEDIHTKGIVGRTNLLWARQLREQVHENFHSGDLLSVSPEKTQREDAAIEFEKRLEHLFLDLDHQSTGTVSRAAVLNRVVEDSTQILELLGVDLSKHNKARVDSRMQLLCMEIYAHSNKNLTWSEFRLYFL